jgi:hypothetical protein
VPSGLQISSLLIGQRDTERCLPEHDDVPRAISQCRSTLCGFIGSLKRAVNKTSVSTANIFNLCLLVIGTAAVVRHKATNVRLCDDLGGGKQGKVDENRSPTA